VSINTSWQVYRRTTLAVSHHQQNRCTQNTYSDWHAI